MTQWAVAQLGARMHYAVPRILHEVGSLSLFYTDICANKGWPRLLQAIPKSLRSQRMNRLLGRVPEGIPPKVIVSFNAFGREYARRRAAAHTSRESTEVHLWAGDRFSDLILRHGFQCGGAVFGFNSACRKLLEAAKDQGHIAVVEQTIAPRLVEHRLHQLERAEAPDWEDEDLDDSLAEFAQREKAEWALADRIICGSEFVVKGIADEGGPIDKCVVVPYGIEIPRFSVRTQQARARGTPLRVLFVGGVGLRKGVRHLLDAMHRLSGSQVQCRVVGSWGANAEVLRRHTPSNVRLVGPVARAEVAQEYAQADVFCLPSLCEGSATVVYEALAAGLPVVTTPNAGSIVRDGVEGFIVRIRDAEAIADRLERLERDRELLAEMSRAARERSQHGSIEAYSRRLLEALAGIEGSE